MAGPEYLGLDAVGWNRMTSTWWDKVRGCSDGRDEPLNLFPNVVCAGPSILLTSHDRSWFTLYSGLHCVKAPWDLAGMCFFAIF